MSHVSDGWLRTILELLYQRRTLTRAEIVECAGLNPASVSLALRWLLDRGTVIKVGEQASDGGRRAEIFSLNGEAAYFVGVDLEGLRIRFALTNLLCDVRRRWDEDLEFGQPLDVRKIQSGVQYVLADLDAAQRARVIAAGVSFPGTLDGQQLLTAVNLGWRKFPLYAELAKMIDVPIFIEPDKHSCIVAERWLGRARDCRSGFFLIVERGIGLGIFVEGKPVEGWHGMTGEIGHSTIDPHSEDYCACGKRGCLETIASSPSIIRQYLQQSGMGTENPHNLRVSDVFERARKNDRSALQVVERAATALGLALSHAVNLLNPEIVVIGGDILSGEDLVLPVIERTIKEHAWTDLVRDLKITVSGLGVDIRLRGAASLAFRRSLGEPRLLKQICAPTQHAAGGARRERRRPKGERSGSVANTASGRKRSGRDL